MIVPYSASLLVNRPGFTSEFQHAAYVPEAADAWLRERFLRLWDPIGGHAPGGGTTTITQITFAWQPVEQAKGYDWEFSTSPAFAVTSRSARTTMPYHTWSMLTDPLPAAQPLYWRVRGIFHVLSYSDAGAVTGTNVYTGAWAPSPAPPLILQDDDLDGLPDAWETHYFGTVAWDGDDDPDGDGVLNAAEYTAATRPNP